MSDTIDELVIDISTNCNNAISNLTQLTNNLKDLREVSKGSVSGLNLIARQINRLGTAIANLPDMARFEQMRDILAEIKGLGKIDVGKIIKADEKKDLSSSVDMGSDDGNEATLREAENLEKVNEQATIYKDTLEEINSKKRAIDLSSEISKTGKSGKDASKTMQEFFSSLKRIAMYRLIRSALKIIVEGLKTGITNLYSFSKLTDGQFSQSMDKITSDIQAIQNSIGVLVAQLIITLEPVITTISDYVVTFNNSLSEALARLMGQSTYWKANTKAVKEYSTSLKSATMGFDELNTLSDTTDYSDMFTEEEVTSSTTHLYDVIKGLAEALTWVCDTVIKPIMDFITGLDLTDFAESFKNLCISMQPAFEFIGQVLKFVLEKILPPVMDVISKIQSFFNKVSDFFKNTFSGVGNFFANLFDGVGNGQKIYYANGGYPTVGQLFVARESGAELVGNIGGHTAVANNDDIVQAVSSGVAQAVSQVMNGGSQNVNVYLDGKQITQAVNKQNGKSAKIGIGGLIYG